MEHSSYGYHSSKHITKPRNTSYNIKGLELEISDWDIGYILDELIEKNEIIGPENSNHAGEKDYTIAIENDSSVYKELVFKATTNRKLLKGVKMLEQAMNNEIFNGSGTSCHIHLNNRFINSLGLTSFDIVKSAEFLAPILYRISGRNYDSYEEWAPSLIAKDILDNNLLERAKLVDNLIERDWSRYHLVNTEGYNTTELRIFSNKFGFNHNYIKLYLECADLIIDLAQMMKGKTYFKEYDNLIKYVKDFFTKRNRKTFYERHDLYEFLTNGVELRIKIYQKELDKTKSKINNFKTRGFNNTNEKMIDFLRILRSINNKTNINFDNFTIKELEYDKYLENIVEKLDEEIKELEEKLEEEL